jgi:hypothetical protein
MGRKSEFGKSRDDWPFSADDVIWKPDRRSQDISK